MSKSGRAPGRRARWFIGLWVGFALIAVALACWGWYLQSAEFAVTGLRRLENALYLTLGVFDRSEVYANAREMGGRWQLVVARWMGASVFLSGVAAAGLALFQAQLAALAASRRRDHTLIIGDHEIAGALAQLARDRRLPTLHLTRAVSAAIRNGSLISLPRGPGDDGLATGRAIQAARVIIAETDLGESAEGALRASERLKDPPARVAVHLEDPAMAERIHHTDAGVDLFAFSEAQAVARSIMLRHPPFLLAHRMGAPAAHVLIVGFDGLGQELARDLVLNGLGMSLGRPHITVIDEHADLIRRDFLHRHPELSHVCAFEVFPHLEEARFGGPETARGRPTICANYVCLADSAKALAAAISLRETAIRHEMIQGPIFTRLRSGGLMRPPGGIRTLQSLRLYGFGGLAEAATASRALLPDPDAAARSVHESYSRLGGASAVSWEQLPEEMRASNRRVVSHIPAKLATLGFDLEPWLAAPEEERPWPPPIALGAPLFRDAAERTRLAMLEHERWMTDRRLNGWRQGRRRDNARRIHTDFMPFEDLSETVKSFDYQVVDWMDAYLPRRPGGLDRPTPDA